MGVKEMSYTTDIGATRRDEARMYVEMSIPWLGFEIKDDWFMAYHIKYLTEDFCRWWIAYYGKPQDCANILGCSEEEEYREYFVRMAFALIGWRGRGQQEEGKPK